jgi:hypothetical protein
MDLSRLDRYIKDNETSVTTEPQMIVIEKTELEKIQAEIDKNLKEIEKKKLISVDIIMSMRKISAGLEKRIEASNKSIEMGRRKND